MKKHTIELLTADKPYHGYSFTQSCLENLVNVSKEIPITNQFQESKIVGWATISHFKDGKLYIKMDLNEYGKDLFTNKKYEIKMGGCLPNNFKKETSFSNFEITTIALCPPVIEGQGPWRYTMPDQTVFVVVKGEAKSAATTVAAGIASLLRQEGVSVALEPLEPQPPKYEPDLVGRMRQIRGLIVRVLHEQLPRA